MQQQNELTDEMKNRIRNIRNLFVGSVDEFTKFEAALQNKSEDELRDLEVKLQVAATHRAETYLGEIYAGLRKGQENRGKIDQRLGPYHTIKQFRDAVLNDQAFKQSLQWDAEPFAEYQQQASEQTASERTRRREFSAVVNSLTANGVANIADHDGNYQVAVNQLEDLFVAGTVQGTFIAALTQALATNLIDGLSPVDSEQQSQLVSGTRQQIIKKYGQYFDGSPEAFQIKQWILNQSVPVGDIRERLSLTEQIVGAISGTMPERELAEVRARRFRSLVASPTTAIESLRQQVADMNHRRDLRKLSREELKALAHKEYEERRAPWVNASAARWTTKLPPVPPEITAQAIREADVKTQKEWHVKYGPQQINERLLGVA